MVFIGLVTISSVEVAICGVVKADTVIDLHWMGHDTGLDAHGVLALDA
jgi:hypothetical protein